MVRNREDLIVSTLDRFHCIGGECPETCCSGWNVHIDKSTYQAYKTSKNIKITEIARENLHIKKTDRSAKNYAVVGMSKNGGCAFLSNDGLCNVQSLIGEALLSKTCRTYPRKIKKFKNRTITSAMLSCPEFARLTLLETSPIDLRPAAVRGNFDKNHATAKYNFQNVDVEIDDKILLLINTALAVASLEHLPSSKKCLAIWGLMKNFLADKEEINPDSVNNFIIPLVTDLAAKDLGISQLSASNFQLELFLNILVRPNVDALSRKTFVILLKEISEVLCKPQQQFGEQLEIFHSAKVHTLKAFEESHSSFWPNILRTELAGLPEMFLSKNLNAEAALKLMFARLALLRFIIIGVAACKGTEFSQDDYIKCVYSTSRAIEHDKRMTDQLMLALEQREENSLLVSALLLD
ncbi:MAG: flagellin lysine-N-methylase [Alphaproteobacteria bacterium]